LAGVRIATAVVVIVGWAGVCAAQYPICPQPDPDQPVYVACVPDGRFAVVPLLTDLTVDLLLKSEGVPIRRDGRELFKSMTSEETFKANSPLADFLDRLEPVELTRTDTATGTVRLEVGENERRLSTMVTIGDSQVRLGLEFPECVEGGYWRTPGVLQVAFWKGQRPSFSTRLAVGTELAAEIDCIALSVDGIRVVTAGTSVPDILIGFEACE
jgi:hypothetical protein